MTSKTQKQKQSRRNQKGGASSDYVGLWHSVGADPAQLSRYTLKYIDQAPLFNPLQVNTILASGTTGIIPTGAYLDSIAPLTVQNSLGPPLASSGQLGGGCQSRRRNHQQSGVNKFNNNWITHVKNFATKNQINYAKALQHPNVRKGYVKISKKTK